MQGLGLADFRVAVVEVSVVGFKNSVLRGGCCHQDLFLVEGKVGNMH